MLRVEGLSKRYGELDALRDVSFEAAEGEVLAVIGANGAGKTTLIKCIAGLLRFDGSASLDGVDLRKHGKRARSRMGYLPQHPAFYPDLTVLETVLFYSKLRGVSAEEARQRLAQAGLEGREEMRTDELSGGMRQRLGLAVALLGDPALLILDEPVSGLDIASRLELRRLVREQRSKGTTVLFSTHWLEDVPYIADRALMLHEGRVVFADSAAALATEQVAASRLYLRLNGHSKDAAPVLRQFAGEHVDRAGDWVVARCPGAQKAQLIEALANAGITVLDFRVEEAPVDEAVMRLQGKEQV